MILTSLLMLGVFTTGNLYGQDDLDDTHKVTVVIPEVALVDIEPAVSKDITFTLTAPTEAGNALTITNDTNTTLWLNYSSILDDATKRTISVKLNPLIAGVDLQLTANAPSTTGDGELGTGLGPITLTTDDQNLVEDIGSCYTGNGSDNGHNLTYKLLIAEDLTTSSYADLVANTGAETTVTYTISE